MACHFPKTQQVEFLSILNRMLEANNAKSINMLVMSRQAHRVTNRIAAQRDAYGRFIMALMEAGSKHDPEFFKPHFETFCRLRDEYNIPLPSEPEIRAEILRRLENCVG